MIIDHESDYKTISSIILDKGSVFFRIKHIIDERKKSKINTNFKKALIFFKDNWMLSLLFLIDCVFI